MGGGAWGTGQAGPQGPCWSLDAYRGPPGRCEQDHGVTGSSLTLVTLGALSMCTGQLGTCRVTTIVQAEKLMVCPGGGVGWE